VPDVLPVAGSRLVRDLVGGPGREGRVLGAFPSAVYVEVAGAREVLALETSDALRLPTALVLAARRDREPFAAVRAGHPAVVGDGRLSAGPLRARVVRWWQPRRVPALPPAAAPDQALDLLPPVSPDVAPAWAELVRDLPGPVLGPRPVRALVGRGGGLTPEGDDLLAGLLVAAAALGPHAPPSLLGLAATVRGLLGRTTVLSAGLLARAADGYAVRPVLDLVAALGAGTGLPAAVVRLSAVGHTSGAALAHGVLRGLRVPRSVPPTGSEIAS
jgi:hypothetical protein